jgi:hypothetical protein
MLLINQKKMSYSNSTHESQMYYTGGKKSDYPKVLWYITSSFIWKSRIYKLLYGFTRKDWCPIKIEDWQEASQCPIKKTITGTFVSSSVTLTPPLPHRKECFLEKAASWPSVLHKMESTGHTAHAHYDLTAGHWRYSSL